MFKVRTILFVALITLTTNSVAHASNVLSPTDQRDEMILLTDASDQRNLVDEETDLETEMDDFNIHFDDLYAMKLLMKIRSEPVIYTVTEGDNLYRIALANDLSLSELMNMNNITGDLIFPGDELIVKQGTGKSEDSPKRQVMGVTAPPNEPVAPSAASTKIEVSAPVVAEAPKTDGSIEMTMEATAYTAYCTGCSGTTAYGIDLRANPEEKVIAVDPRIIPLGTRVWVEGYGEAIAGDTGGAIKGNKIDVFMPSYENAMQWGRKQVKLIILD
ncbi:MULTISPECIES: 3D domain-containing protein [Psychrobacillus]|uniref:LysM peptidoglycan-binding domain-containing protein n=1 Tax=Psychrobacillus faecigallinarum TaxID=2762235 RepID=A0ABR8RF39_9BACI|nr:3D domain-containing protein [Psychrobacillus faecigallinarum]MBD7946360.1 LysM peptidoglycan-binding domain-containing protein [Psychrobacillus faecigallinarum]